MVHSEYMKAINLSKFCECIRHKLVCFVGKHHHGLCVICERTNIHRVAQNKPDYLFLLSKFCISTTKHVSMIMYV